MFTPGKCLVVRRQIKQVSHDMESADGGRQEEMFMHAFRGEMDNECTRRRPRAFRTPLRKLSVRSSQAARQGDVLSQARKLKLNDFVSNQQIRAVATQ